MAITAEQQTSILEVAIGLFNAAPGKVFMTELANLVDANGGNLSISQLADALADTPAFKNNILIGNVTIEDQANILMTNFGLAADVDPASAGSQAKAFFEGELAAGKGLGAIVIEAINYLNGPPAPAQEFATTATLLANKVLVSKAYSAAGSSTDIALLQTVLSKVTGDVPYTPEDVQQALADSGVPAGDGQSFALIVGEDSLTGTSGDDVFTALVTQNNAGNPVNTLESIDSLDGGTGNDTLTATLESANSAPALTSIENIIARFAAAVTLDLSNATGVNAITVQSSTDAGTVSAVGDAATLSVRNQKQDVTFQDNNATNLNLNLDTVGDFTTPTQNTVTLDTGATTLNLSVNNANAAIATLASVKTLNVAARGTNEIAQGSGAATTKATITGTGSVELQDAFTVLTTLDATGNSGGVTATVDATAVTVNTGSGNDNIVYTEALGATAAVALGEGDDRFAITAASTAGATVDAGGGDDTLAVTDGAFLDADAQDVYSNFETLEIGDTVTATGGTGTYDMDNLPGLGAVTIGTALAGATVIDNAAADTMVTVNAGEATDLTLGQTLDYALKTATGTSDDVALTLNALDGDDDGVAGEGVITVDSFTADDIESFTIASNIAGIDPDFANTDYTNTISALDGNAVETLNISGNANLEITSLAATTVKTIDASTLTGALTVDASASNGVEFLGGAGGDTYTGTTGGDTVAGNGGADAITLDGTFASTDTLILNAAGDSVLNADVDGHDIITNFGTAAGGGSLDVIDVGVFGFTGQQASALANKGALAASAVNGTTLSATNFFASGGLDRGVAIGTNGGDTYLFIDANKDGDFTATDDAVLQLVGVTDVTLANFGF